MKLGTSIVIAAMAALMSTGAMAQATGKKNPGQTGDNPPGWSSQGERKGWDGGTQPPGYDKGERKGWNNQSSPPGHTK